MNGQYPAPTFLSKNEERHDATIFPRGTSIDDVYFHITNILGLNVQHVEQFESRIKIHARKNSLSSIYGLGQQPFHTDFATEVRPAKYVALVRTKPVKACTTFIDLEPIFQTAQSSNALFACTVPVESRIRTIRLPSDRPLRINSVVYRPVNRAAEYATQLLPSAPIAFTAHWEQTLAVMFNNHRYAHARGPIEHGSPIERWRIH